VSDRQTIIPEVLPPDEELPPDLLALEQMARLLDEAVEIPGIRRRVGLDAMTGLVPGIGDAIGAALSAWIIIGGLRHRVPARKIGRMIFNVLVDLGLGSVPVLGDVFDAFYHQNSNNVRIVLDHRKRGRPPRTWRQVGVIGLLVFLLLLAASLAVTIGVVLAIVKIAALMGVGT
jgi:hypothetical protein